VALYIIAVGYQNFGGPYCFCLQCESWSWWQRIPPTRWFIHGWNVKLVSNDRVHPLVLLQALCVCSFRNAIVQVCPNPATDALVHLMHGPCNPHLQRILHEAPQRDVPVG